ncbi:hypothetical protein BDY24DRAFT_77141 [Mrakia frigida]|uniref:uncharacterized protein n=1 Tax=Mrakia frigida TaxID=29902 RepID=UPI003FCC031E
MSLQRQASRGSFEDGVGSLLACGRLEPSRRRRASLLPHRHHLSSVPFSLRLPSLIYASRVQGLPISDRVRPVDAFLVSLASTRPHIFGRSANSPSSAWNHFSLLYYCASRTLISIFSSVERAWDYSCGATLPFAQSPWRTLWAGPLLSNPTRLVFPLLHLLKVQRSSH